LHVSGRRVVGGAGKGEPERGTRKGGPGKGGPERGGEEGNGRGFESNSLCNERDSNFAIIHQSSIFILH
jgi:hypothetical protein